MFARVILLINARSGSAPSSAVPTQSERNLNKGLKRFALAKANRRILTKVHTIIITVKDSQLKNWPVATWNAGLSEFRFQ